MATRLQWLAEVGQGPIDGPQVLRWLETSIPRMQELESNANETSQWLVAREEMLEASKLELHQEKQAVQELVRAAQEKERVAQEQLQQSRAELHAERTHHHFILEGLGDKLQQMGITSGTKDITAQGSRQAWDIFQDQAIMDPGLIEERHKLVQQLESSAQQIANMALEHGNSIRRLNNRIRHLQDQVSNQFEEAERQRHLVQSREGTIKCLRDINSDNQAEIRRLRGQLAKEQRGHRRVSQTLDNLQRLGADPETEESQRKTSEIGQVRAKLNEERQNHSNTSNQLNGANLQVR